MRATEQTHGCAQKGAERPPPHPIHPVFPAPLHHVYLWTRSPANGVGGAISPMTPARNVNRKSGSGPASGEAEKLYETSPFGSDGRWVEVMKACADRQPGCRSPGPPCRVSRLCGPDLMFHCTLSGRNERPNVQAPLPHNARSGLAHAYRCADKPTPSRTRMPIFPRPRSGSTACPPARSTTGVWHSGLFLLERKIVSHRHRGRRVFRL